MANKLPWIFSGSKVCIICEGDEEYEYLDTLLAGAILLFTIYLCMNLETIWGWLISNWRWIALACSIVLFLFAFMISFVIMIVMTQCMQENGLKNAY